MKNHPDGSVQTSTRELTLHEFLEMSDEDIRARENCSTVNNFMKNAALSKEDREIAVKRLCQALNSRISTKRIAQCYKGPLNFLSRENYKVLTENWAPNKRSNMINALHDEAIYRVLNKKRIQKTSGYLVI